MWRVEIQHFDSPFDDEDHPWIQVPQRYKTKASAEKAAIQLESRNMARGAECCTRVVQAA